MLKKTVKYEDFDGNEREEDFYFNLTKAELIDLEMSNEGGLDKFLDRIMKEKSSVKLIDMFKKIVIMAYGVKSDDGKRFVKNDTVREEFLSTNAYSEIFTELASDADAAAKFMVGIMPKDIKIDEAQLKAFQNNNK